MSGYRPLRPNQGEAKPISYFGAAAFQWVNPKAWIMAIGAISTYTPMQGYFTNVVVIAAVFAIINLPSVGIWVGCGTLLRNVLKDPRLTKAPLQGSQELRLVATPAAWW